MLPKVVNVVNGVLRLRGSSGTIIGNNGDRLKVDALISNTEIKTTDGLSSGGVYGSVTLTTGGTAYEAKVGSSRLANRKLLTITAMDDVYWGYDNAVTTTTGTPLFKNQQITFDIEPTSSFQVWVVASSNGKTIRVTESV